MTDEINPLHSLDDWEDDLLRRYPRDPEPRHGKPTEEFRSYDDAADHVKEFYRLNHRQQTVEINLEKREEFLKFEKRRMGIWEAMEYLNTLVDDSDRDAVNETLTKMLRAKVEFCAENRGSRSLVEFHTG